MRSDINILWDASGLLKRYASEVGSDIVDELFRLVPPTNMIASAWCYSETYAILVRKHNRGEISLISRDLALSALESEVLRNPNFRFAEITDQAVLSSLHLIMRHNINATDAAFLHSCLQIVQQSAMPSAIVSADKRLERAAQAEGLPVINPEAIALPDVISALSHLQT